MTASDQLPLPLLEIAERARREVDLLTREIGEIELLTNQARSEASRHEQKRTQAAEKVLPHSDSDTKDEAEEAIEQLLSLTRRAAIMEAQVDILDGKLKVLRKTSAGKSLGQCTTGRPRA